MALALGLSLAACGPSGDEGAVSSIKDSAGIRIVRNSPDASADSCAIASEPAVTIGGREDSLEAPLYNVVDGTRLSDGRIAALISESVGHVKPHLSRGAR